MSIRTLASIVFALAALLLVALPTGAAAHGGMAHGGMAHGSVAHGGAAHPHAMKHVPDNRAVRNAPSKVQLSTLPAEVRMQPFAPSTDRSHADCSDRGCCGAGHCSGGGTALTPAAWMSVRISPATVFPAPDPAPPAQIARDGPSRPPNSFA